MKKNRQLIGMVICACMGVINYTSAQQLDFKLKPQLYSVPQQFDDVRWGSLAFADIDGDGDEDVLITGYNTTYQSTANLYLSNGDGSFSLVPSTPFEGVRFSSIAFSDIDNDGDKDVLITGENAANVRVSNLYKNNGTGIFTLVLGTPFPGVRSSAIAFSDVDNDGDEDVLITGEPLTGSIISNLYTNNGNGVFRVNGQKVGYEPL